MMVIEVRRLSKAFDLTAILPFGVLEIATTPRARHFPFKNACFRGLSELARNGTQRARQDAVAVIVGDDIKSKDANRERQQSLE
jgi:hypothetical protein